MEIKSKLRKFRQRKKRTICLFFNVHQPYRLKTYRFFNIGQDHYYYDEVANRNILNRIAQNCYLPANCLLTQLIRKYGSGFKASFGISGTALEQFKRYAPGVLESFRRLYATGNIELVAEANAYSLAMIASPKEYLRQVEEYKKSLEHDFGCQPTAFMNTNLVYSNGLAGLARKMGFKAILTEGANQPIGNRNSNFLYASQVCPDVKILLRNYQLSDDIAFRFSSQNWSEWPLTPDKFISWLNALDKSEEIVNLVIDYEVMGELQKKETGIFNFLKSLFVKIIDSGKWNFKTISEAAGSINPAAELRIQETIASSERNYNLSTWLGNELQQEAYHNLYSVAHIMEHCDNQELLSDWDKLQTCDHFYYMNTNYQDEVSLQHFFSPYNSPYEAFVNYMNVLTDFMIRGKDYAARQAEIVKQKYQNHNLLLETL